MTAARRLFFIVFAVTLMTEALPLGQDPYASWEWYIHADLKTWLHASGVAFSPVELLLVLCAIIWFFRDDRAKRGHPFQRGQLLVPLIWLAVALTIGVVWGLAHGGDHNFALFEVRGFGVLIFAYVLVGMVLRDERDLNTLVWCVLIACAGLATENIVRYFVVLHGSIPNDLVYDHDDSLILGFGVILCLAILAFGGTRKQRRFAWLLLPVSILCLELMHRRVAFAILPIGLIGLAVVYYRLRPKQFWRVVPVLAVLCGMYLAVFWNNTGTLGQPARAIRSQFTPDPRDASSDSYRIIERLDILQNIATSRLMGLGFGQPYTFFDPLPDLSYWPFWHFTSHNAVLWIWMDGGIPAFFTFFWVLGAGTSSGAQELSVRREAWSLTQLRLWRSRHQRGRTRQGRSAQAGETPVPEQAQGTNAAALSQPSSMTRGRRRGAEAAKSTQTAQTAQTAALALIASGICLTAMQVTYSYVDLGISNDPRTMLLLGVLLGVMGRKYVSLSARSRRRHRRTPVGATNEAVNAGHPTLANDHTAARPHAVRESKAPVPAVPHYSERQGTGWSLTSRKPLDPLRTSVPDARSPTSAHTHSNSPWAHRARSTTSDRLWSE